jgi:translation initiation factor 1
MVIKTNSNDAALVYSTEFGKMCPGCQKPAGKCLCQRRKVVLQGDGIVRLQRETKGRKGKGVTLITGLPLDHEGLKNFAKVLKQKCGSGGSLKDGVIVIQGDHGEMLEKELDRHGYIVKRAGG